LATINFRIVVEQEEEIASLDHCGVLGLSGPSQPQALADLRIDTEELTACPMRQAEQRIGDDNWVTHVH
jgi:hypothetical protein